MQRVSDFMAPLLQRFRLDRPPSQAGAMALWPEIVGPLVAEKTAPVEVRGGVLFVRTASSTWMAELTAGFRHIYLEALQARLGPNAITDIRFLPPPLPRRSGRRSQAAPEEAAAVPRPQPTAQEVQDARHMVSGVEEDHLRALLERLVAVQKALDRVRSEKGWTPCSSCGGLVEIRGVCAVCRNRLEYELDRRIHGVLIAAPWSTALDVRSFLPEVTSEQCSRVKGSLLARLHAVLRHWDTTRPVGDPFPRSLVLLAIRYALLRTGRRPHELQEADIRRSLGRLAPRYPAADGSAGKAAPTCRP